MERHFASLGLPDPANDPKITRAITFSELPTKFKILIKQCYRKDENGVSVTQYSCEQTFNKFSNSRETSVSDILKMEKDRPLSDIWGTALPVKSGDTSGWGNAHFGRSTRALEPCRTVESMEVEEIDVEPCGKELTTQRSPKFLPIMELNEMSLSDAKDRGRRLFKASTFQSPRTERRNNFSRSFFRSRSASPKKVADLPVLAKSQFSEFFKKSSTGDVPSNDCPVADASVPSLLSEPSFAGSRRAQNFRSCYKFVFFFLLSVSAAIAAIILYDDPITSFRQKRLYDLDVRSMRVELRDRVYGQERAIEALVKEFDENDFWGTNLVILIGGTGVGKSYAVRIVSKYFLPFDRRVFEYFPPLASLTVHNIFGLFSRRHCNLVIIENVRKGDFHDVAEFVRYANENETILCVRMVAIFNPEETRNDLRQREFNSTKVVGEISTFLRERDLADASLIVFENLDEDSVDACIRRTSKDANINLTDEELTEIRGNLMEAGSGCKGAYARVRLLGKT